jgi:hypothetical protein
MKILQVAASLKTVQQYFKASKCWTVRFVHLKGLAGCWRIRQAQKLPTGYPGSFIAYQLHIINLHEGGFSYICINMVCQYQFLLYVAKFQTTPYGYIYKK